MFSINNSNAYFSGIISFASLAQPTFTNTATYIPADPAQAYTTYTLVAGSGNTITSIAPLGDLQIGTITPAHCPTALLVLAKML